MTTVILSDMITAFTFLPPIAPPHGAVVRAHESDPGFDSSVSLTRGPRWYGFNMHIWLMLQHIMQPTGILSS